MPEVLSGSLEAECWIEASRGVLEIMANNFES